MKKACGAVINAEAQRSLRLKTKAFLCVYSAALRLCG